MIKKIRIQNFQAHKKLLIEFDPKITTIIGPSDVGKSSIVRALAWVAFNSPAGMAFIREGSKGCSVTITIDDHTVKRKRAKTANQYEVDGRTYSAIRKGEVPEPVIAAVRLDELNFQRQHDSPLWLTESAGQVARNLNKIVNLDLIDRVLTRLNKHTRSKQSEADLCLRRLNEAQTVKEQLEWAKQANSDYRELEQIEKHVQDLETRSTQLEAMIDSVNKKSARIEKLKAVVKSGSAAMESISSLRTTRQQHRHKRQQLAEVIEAVSKANAKALKVNRALQQAKDELSTINICPICGAQL